MENKNLNEEIVSELEKDARKILNKLTITLNMDKDSTYKMLINNLRETKELIDNIKGKNNKVININNMHLDNKVDAGQLIEQLKEITSITSVSGKSIGEKFMSVDKNLNKIKHYYKSNSTEDGYMKYDKHYVEEKSNNKNEFIKILAENDIVYLDEIYQSSVYKNEKMNTGIAGVYLRNISLLQYRDLRFKDSKF